MFLLGDYACVRFNKMLFAPASLGYVRVVLLIANAGGLRHWIKMI